MKKTFTALAMIVVLGGAIWFAMNWRSDSIPGDAAADQAIPHDFEAQGVVLRQLDEDGVLLYEIEAERIVRVRDAGDIVASRLTLRHDPPGTTPGSPQRWILTAEEARLPAAGGVVTLVGKVRATSTPEGGRIPLQLDANELTYDMDRQEVYSAGEVTVRRGATTMIGKGMRVNIAADVMKIESGGHGTIIL